MQILEGVFLPGDRLTKDHIAQQFNCSRTPVREALRKLEQENIQGYGQKILPYHYP
ncbi:GntR family transcriptional regulator [Peribacillus butanolivorans]|uniref:GntR family transcriptional regulator n=1 Tax=Peribacillus butanolivorans TaxID=421767 RepID=UPI0037FC2AAE